MARRAAWRASSGESLRAELLDLVVQVILQLVVEFLLDAVAPEERTEPQGTE